jgi:hypothetical protein
MLENNVCNDRIRNDEVANILLSFTNRKNKLDNSCNDEEEKSMRERIRVTNMTNLKLR